MAVLRSLLLSLLALLAGCAVNAPQYSATISNVEAASKLPGRVAVGKFDLAEPSLNEVSARGTSFPSPVNGSYADYLAAAATADLKSAGKLDESSRKVLTGTIQKNSLSAAGINTNDAEVAVRFRVTEGAKASFDKTITTRHEWESSFLGGIAIPRALQNYVTTLQKLLLQLYSDPDFAGALR